MAAILKLDGLPPELLDFILSYMQIQQLLTMRLVSRFFVAPAAAFAFRTVTYHLGSGGCTNFERIASSHLREYVRTCRLASRTCMPTFEDIEDWRRATIFEVAPAPTIQDLPCSNLMSNDQWKSLSEKQHRRLWTEYKIDYEKHVAYMRSLASKWSSPILYPESSASQSQIKSDCAGQTLVALNKSISSLTCPIAFIQSRQSFMDNGYRWRGIEFVPEGLWQYAAGSEVHEAAVHNLELIISLHMFMHAKHAPHFAQFLVADIAFWTPPRFCDLLMWTEEARLLPYTTFDKVYRNWAAEVGPQVVDKYLGKLGHYIQDLEKRCFARLSHLRCQINTMFPYGRVLETTSALSRYLRNCSLHQLEIVLHYGRVIEDFDWVELDDNEELLRKASSVLLGESCLSNQPLQYLHLSLPLDSEDLIRLFGQLHGLRKLRLSRVILLPGTGRWECVLERIARDLRSLRQIDLEYLGDTLSNDTARWILVEQMWHPHAHQRWYAAYKDDIEGFALGKVSQLPPLCPQDWVSLQHQRERSRYIEDQDLENLPVAG